MHMYGIPGCIRSVSVKLLQKHCNCFINIYNIHVSYNTLIYFKENVMVHLHYGYMANVNAAACVLHYLTGLTQSMTQQEMVHGGKRTEPDEYRHFIHPLTPTTNMYMNIFCGAEILLKAYSHQRRAFFFLLRKFCCGYIKTPYI